MIIATIGPLAVVLIAILLVWGIGFLPFKPLPKQVLAALVIFMAVVLIARSVGLF